MTLPGEFEELERFSAWALASENERSERRLSSTMEEISEFYAAMHAQMGAILSYLGRHDVAEMPEDAKQLLDLTLSLAEIAPSVEWYDQPAVIDGFDRRRYRSAGHPAGLAEAGREGSSRSRGAEG
jgi:hypothetical protein